MLVQNKLKRTKEEENTLEQYSTVANVQLSDKTSSQNFYEEFSSKTSTNKSIADTENKMVSSYISDESPNLNLKFWGISKNDIDQQKALQYKINKDRQLNSTSFTINTKYTRLGCLIREESKLEIEYNGSLKFEITGKVFNNVFRTSVVIMAFIPS